eukprot:768523-Hanusia_phi.AAC.1
MMWLARYTTFNKFMKIDSPTNFDSPQYNPSCRSSDLFQHEAGYVETSRKEMCEARGRRLLAGGHGRCIRRAR